MTFAKPYHRVLMDTRATMDNSIGWLLAESIFIN